MINGILFNYMQYKQQKPVDYSDKEREYRKMVLREVEEAREVRDSSHTEFNDMTYLEYYESNANAARAYNPPKKNKEDIRIVSGTTEEKVNTMLAAVLSYNFQPNFEAYDKQDNVIDWLGETMEDMVLKSRDLENYDDKRRIYYKEALDQGDCFVEEIWEQPVIVEKIMKDDAMNSNKFSAYKWIDRVKVLRGEAKTNIIDGRNFYFGNFSQFDFDSQPYIVTRELIHKDIAKTIYGEWERWKYVPDFYTSVMTNDDDLDANDYVMYDIKGNYVEVIKYQNKARNEFQVFLNGVMMLPAQFPLSYVNGCDEQGMPVYNVVRLSVNPVGHNCAYSKSIPAKTKVKQGVKDELLKLMILKTQQSFKPPLANNTGSELSSNILRPGQVTDDIDGDKLKPIIPANGVTSSEYNMYTLIGQEIDELSTNKQFGGESEDRTKSATEVVQQKQQSMMKLGSTLWGIMEFERRLAILRSQTILRYWTQPIDSRVDDTIGKLEKVYRSMSIDSIDKKGNKVRKVLRFDEEFPDKYDLYTEAEKMRKKTGKKTAIRVLDPILMSTVQYFWKVITVATERDPSALERELLLNDIGVMQKIFEPQGIKLNYEYLKKETARAMRRDPDKFFATDDMTDIMMTQVPGEQGEVDPLEAMMRNPTSKQVAENLNPTTKTQPSVRELIKE